MLMADMSESERKTTRDLNAHWLPNGAELLEIVNLLWGGWECDHAMALFKMPDGSVRLMVLASSDHPDNDDPFVLLTKRIAAYERAVADTRRFIEIAHNALADIHADQLMREIYQEFEEIGSLGDGDET